MVLLGIAIGGAAWAQSDVERNVIELQQNEEWGSPAHKWINDLGPNQTLELVPLIGKIERWHALNIVATKLANAGVDEAIPELIKTLSRRYPTNRKDHPAFEPLKSFGWKAIGPLIRAIDSNDPGTVFYAADLLQIRCQYLPEDKRLLPVMQRLAKSRNPELETLALRGLYQLAFRFEGGWMGEVPITVTMENREALTALDEVLMTGSYQASEEAKKHLFHFLRHAPIEGERPAFGTMGGDTLANFIGSSEVYRENKLPEVRMVVLAMLAHYENTGMAHIAALGDEEEAVRQTAVRALMLKFDAAWVPEMAKHLAATSPGVRAAAAKALGWSFQPSAATLLREHLEDESAGVREAVQAAIDRIEGRGLKKVQEEGLHLPSS